MEWNVLNIWSSDGMSGFAGEVTAEKDGKTVYVAAGTTEFGYHYVVSSKSLFGSEDNSGTIIAEYPNQKSALASEYGSLFRKAIDAYRK